KRSNKTPAAAPAKVQATPVFRKLLVANRSEIAIRVCRAATELGLRTVAIYAQEDRLSVHRFKADEAYLIGEGKGPVGAYLDIEGIVALAKEKQVDMIHPGYGFLAENANFARACEKAGIVFVGPRPELLDLMGDNVAARSFGNAAVFLEKYIPRAKHIEVQVLGDKHHQAFHLHERDCSVQRRHQKVVEIAPSLGLDDAVRKDLCAAALRMAREIAY